MSTPRTHHPWTAGQLATLEREWHEVAARTLRAKLRPHTWTAIVIRAAAMGLPRGVPQGCEYVSVAARRVGVARETLVKWCAEQGVRLRVAYAGERGLKSAPLAQRRYLERDEATAVVERFTRDLESITGAAKRYGVHSCIMWDRLNRAGLLPANRRRYAPLRMPSAVYDAAMVGYRPRKRRAPALQGAA